MKLRILSLSILALLAACNNSSDSPVSESTFAPEVAAAALPPIVASYNEIAPKAHSFQDQNAYNFYYNGALDLAAVDETPSVKHHQMLIHGKAVNFTASAGHLIAKAPAGMPNPEKAAIFYMAYTRDDLPHENRPVTFFWNGGPGSSSYFLHMGSWAPQRIKVGMPIIPEEAKKTKPQSFPLVENEETLLDQSDLVFVDPVGTGLSQAIAPHQNREFWGMDSDAQVLRDFITRYINKNNRQSSPKYLYGESYGGIRTPVVANLLEQAGTANYEPDPSGKKPIVLSGVVLNSPLLDYSTNSGQGASASNAGLLPTLAMIADYYKKGTMRGADTVPEYLRGLKNFIKDKYNPARKIWYEPEYAKLKYNRDSAASDIFIKLKDRYKNGIPPFDDHFPLNGLYAEVPPGVEELSRNKDIFIQSEGSDPGRDFVAFIFAIASSAKDFIADAKMQEEFLSKELMKKLILQYYIGKAYDSFSNAPYFADLTAKALEQKGLPKGWLDYTKTPKGIDFINDMKRITGLDVDWVNEFEISYTRFMELIMPDSSLNPYDARLNIPKGAYDITFYEDDAFKAGINTVLTDVFDYHFTSKYMGLNEVIQILWQYKRDAGLAYYKSSIPDLVEILNYDPTVKMLILHGYYDLVCPFYQTELDLLNVGLAARIPVKNFEGGHMMYESEEARVPLKQELDKFYGAPSVLVLQ